MKLVNGTAFTVLLLVGALMLGATTSAHASYLDPGTTSYLFQMAVAGVFGLLFSARQAIKRLAERKHDQHAPEKKQ